MPNQDQSPRTLEPIFISIKDTAEMLSLTVWEVRNKLLDTNVIESTYHGRRRLVVLESVRAYAESLRTGQAS